MRTRPVGRCLVAILVATTVVAQAQQKHFLWVVRQAGAPPTYLMGSLHVLTPEYYPLAPVIDQAFTQSKVLIEEVDLDEANNPLIALSLVGTAMLTDGRTLSQIISPPLYKQVLVRAEKAGLPEIALERMKPWMAAISLIAPALKAAGYDAERGVDKHFFDRAKRAGVEVRGLETVEYQLSRLDQLSPPMQEAMLQAAISDLDTEIANVKTIAQAWSRGDTATIERLLLGALLQSPELYEKLLVERNRNWVAPIERCLKERTPCFVVVGAAHLVGAHSVPNLLRQKGYAVDQQ